MKLSFLGEAGTVTIVNGASEVNIHGQAVPIRAKIVTMSNLSAHADYSEILQWLGHFKRAPIKTFITHGEPEPAASLKQKIEEKFSWDCFIPEYLQTMEL